MFSCLTPPYKLKEKGGGRSLKSIREALGQRIRALREQHGWTQEQLAERAELHPNYIGQIERGLKNVSLDNIN